MMLQQTGGATPLLVKNEKKNYMGFIKHLEIGNINLLCHWISTIRCVDRSFFSFSLPKDLLLKFTYVLMILLSTGRKPALAGYTCF